MRRFRAILARENVETTEGWISRIFPANLFTWRDLPLTLRGTVEDQGAHFGAFPLGRIDKIERIGDFIVAAGILDDEGQGDDADRRRDVIRQIELKVINGISVDPGSVEATEECTATDADGFCEHIDVTFTTYKIAAATCVATPALEGTLIELLANDSGDAEGEAQRGGGDMTPAEALDAIAAAAAPAMGATPIPRDWFDDPGLTELTRIPVVEESGRVYGHLEGWEDCHLNFADYCQTPWRSPTGYSFFHVCAVDTTEGPLGVGPLAATGGHFAAQGEQARDWHGAQSHYDDPETCVAYVRVGEDEHGKWFAGALRSGVSPEQVAFFRHHRLSTDHRKIGGAMELVGACSVNVPGFVSEYAQVASAAGDMEPIAAVRAGRAVCEECQGAHETGEHGRAAVLASVHVHNNGEGDERLDRIERDLSRLMTIFEPQLRETLRGRMRV